MFVLRSYSYIIIIHHLHSSFVFKSCCLFYWYCNSVMPMLFNMRILNMVNNFILYGDSKCHKCARSPSQSVIFSQCLILTKKSTEFHSWSLSFPLEMSVYRFKAVLDQELDGRMSWLDVKWAQHLVKPFISLALCHYNFVSLLLIHFGCCYWFEILLIFS